MIFSRYNLKDYIQSIYCYEDTDILINKLDIRDKDLLSEAEAEYTAQRLLELDLRPLNGKFTSSHLMNIHKFIFQDIYPFSGKIRLEDISKGETMFARSQFIKDSLKGLLSHLKNENYLNGLQISDFSARVAYYMAELNIIHPFREGNGRAIREFIRCLGIKNGYIINWDAVNKDRLLQASILSVGDSKELAVCIETCIEKE